MPVCLLPSSVVDKLPVSPIEPQPLLRGLDGPKSPDFANQDPRGMKFCEDRAPRICRIHGGELVFESPGPTGVMGVGKD